LDTSSVAYSYPDVFILESLNFDDEERQRFEGRILYRMLRLAGKNPKYYYFRTKSELVELASVYRKSQYRFLHLSCHGTGNGIQTTLDQVSNFEFATIFKGILKNRRLFVSACETGNELFSECVFGQNKGMYSILAPKEAIRFDHAAAIWNSLYVQIFSENQSFVKNATIRNALFNLSNMFNVEFHWSWNDTYKKNVVHQQIKSLSKGIPSNTFPTKSINWSEIIRDGLNQE